jgi:hypothetical protein
LHSPSFFSLERKPADLRNPLDATLADGSPDEMLWFKVALW